MSKPIRKLEAGDGAARYENDLYGWSSQQTDHLEGGRIAKLDLINLAEEIADVGSEQYDKLESALRILLRTRFAQSQLSQHDS